MGVGQLALGIRRTSCPGRPGRTAGSSSSFSPRGWSCGWWGLVPVASVCSGTSRSFLPVPSSLPLTFPRMGQQSLHSIPPILQMEKPRPQE